MNKSDSIAKLADALSKAQAVMENAVKDSANPFFKSSYADLASVWAACRKPLADNGLAVVQAAGSKDGAAVITTLLCHSSGEWVSEELTLTPTKDDPQGLGSAITYGRRYALAAMVGIAPEDDDGNAASAPSPLMYPTTPVTRNHRNAAPRPTAASTAPRVVNAPPTPAAPPAAPAAAELLDEDPEWSRFKLEAKAMGYDSKLKTEKALGKSIQQWFNDGGTYDSALRELRQLKGV